MIREDVFTMRVTAEERQLIEALAAREERTASDTIRRLIRQAVQNGEIAPRRQTESAPVRPPTQS